MLNDLVLGKEDVREYESHCKLTQKTKTEQKMAGELLLEGKGQEQSSALDEASQQSQQAHVASSAGSAGGVQLSPSQLLPSSLSLTVSVLTDGSWPSPLR